MVHVNKDDTLPKQLCQHCFGDLTNCYKFVDKCRRSEQKLMAVLNQKETEIKLEEIETPSDEVEKEEIEIRYLKMDVTETDLSHQTQMLSAVVNQADINTLNMKIEPPEITTNEFEQQEMVITPDQTKIKIEELEAPSDEIKQDEIDINDLGINPETQKRNRESLQHPANKKLRLCDSYKCRFCEISFTMEKERIIHESTHTGEMPYKCNCCDKSFMWRTDHVSHTGLSVVQKPYKCDFCEQSFLTRNEQVLHEKSHTGERLHKCDFCEETFVWKKDRIVHERVHRDLAKRLDVDTQGTHTTGLPFLAVVTSVTVEDLMRYLKSDDQGDTPESERALDIFRYFGVLPVRETEVNCPNCGIPLRTGNRMGKVLHWRYFCKNCSSVEPTQNTLFFKTRLKEIGPHQLLILMSFWLEKVGVTAAAKRLGISSKSASLWYKCCRGIATKAVWHAFKPIGDANDIVEIGKISVYKGKKSEGLWVLGGISRTSKKLFCVPVDSPYEDILLPLMQSYIDHESYICTDTSAVFRNCGTVFAGHGLANDSKRLWAPPGRFHAACLDGPSNEDGMQPYRNHVQNMESTWEKLKMLLTSSNRNNLDIYVGEFMYRENILRDYDSFGVRLQRFLQDTKQAYPGIGRVPMALKFEECHCHICEPTELKLENSEAPSTSSPVKQDGSFCNITQNQKNKFVPLLQENSVLDHSMTSA